MIIGISGKIGSGKDTIGTIIQYLTYNQGLREDQKVDIVVALTNKNAVHKIEPKELAMFSKWHVKKFAGKLKQIVSILIGIPVEDLEKQEIKNSVLGEEWDRTISNNFKVNLPLDMRKISVRQMLQWVGTDAMRDVIHPNIWVNALFTDYRINFEAKNVEEWGKNLEDNWIITDVRFPNELQAVKDRKGISIRVIRRTTQGISNHPSEIALDDAKFDYTIYNDGTIEELIEKVKQILIKEGIINGTT
jgi:hypothetical protein